MLKGDACSTFIDGSLFAMKKKRFSSIKNKMQEWEKLTK